MDKVKKFTNLLHHSRVGIGLALGMALSVGLGPGCANHYYGYTQAQWRELDAAEREAAIRQFDAMLEVERERAHKERFIEPAKQTIIDRGIEKIAP